jgi:hypothetical protein
MESKMRVSDEALRAIRSHCEATIRLGHSKAFVNPQDALDLLDDLADTRSAAQEQSETVQCDWLSPAEAAGLKAALADAEARNRQVICAYCGWTGERGAESMAEHVKSCSARLGYEAHLWNWIHSLERALETYANPSSWTRRYAFQLADLWTKGGNGYDLARDTLGTEVRSDASE